MVEEREFTREELARHDGVSEPTVYVACQGVVYDVTASPLWKSGTHVRTHTAGRDLTPELGAAPHSEEVFCRVARGGGPGGRARRLPGPPAGAPPRPSSEIPGDAPAGPPGGGPHPHGLGPAGSFL